MYVLDNFIGLFLNMFQETICNIRFLIETYEMRK